MLESRTESAEAGRTVTLVGVLVNAFLILFKFLAGIYGHSQALIADAVHSVSDLFTDFVVLLGLRIGRKAPDEKHHFGHARIETLASAIVGLALIATALYLGIKAIWNIYHHIEYHPTWLALVGAGASIALKEALYHYTIHIGRCIKSSAIVANAWHQRSDALSSVAVLLGVAGASIKPSWHILDSYAALCVSFFIIKVGLEILWGALREFIDTAPQPEILSKIRQCSLSVDGVIDMHDLRARTSGGLHQMELHIVVNGRLTVTEGHLIAKAVESCLAKEIADLDRVIVHVDPAIEEKEAE
ncbi:MAG: cation transporter [Thermoplasmatales archaeon]|nr:cation transporter [Thermoplasmatales archaeon]